MSINEEHNSTAGFDSTDHQPAYIFTPFTSDEDTPERPAKRRRVAKPPKATDRQESVQAVQFESLLNGRESPECVTLRQELFTRYWGETEERIQSILGEANEGTLAQVTSFVQDTIQAEDTVPAGFIVTGPNIASQSLLFKQLSERLKEEINGPIVTLRSGDSSNLKAAIKQLIRDATNQRSIDEEEEGVPFELDGRKLLNYDLEILHGFVKTHGTKKVIVAFQDSEAFDSVLLAELIGLFSSWIDRIPFVLLFGIATSVELFNERLSRAASRCLYGAQFDVEQTSLILERVFQKTIAGSQAPLWLSPLLVSSLMERQHDHVQSVQAFTAALKYAYMCHFYANPLSILNDPTGTSKSLKKLLQPEHYEAVRMLPSFRNLVESAAKNQATTLARSLLEDNEVLFGEIEKVLDSKERKFINLLRAMHVLSVASPGPVGKIDLYLKAFKGTLSNSDTVRSVLHSVKKMRPDGLMAFIIRIEGAMEAGNLELDLEGWLDEVQNSKLIQEIGDIQKQVNILVEESMKTGKPVRSSYAVHSKGLRTTVIAQKVQLSYEKSTLSKEDTEYTALVDCLSTALEQYFTFDNPQDLFLNEVWLYDSISPYRDVFTPRPRFVIERALSAPQDYLESCDTDVEALSANKPATAILYQMYLESGTLVNISDIWTAFFSIVGGEDGDGYDERTALMLFYRGLADLKLLGMVKQSKKKVDHLAKSAWKGL